MAEIRGLRFTTKGGPGSGNFGHSGRPGQVGGAGASSGGGGGSGGAAASASQWSNLPKRQRGVLESLAGGRKDPSQITGVSSGSRKRGYSITKAGAAALNSLVEQELIAPSAAFGQYGRMFRITPAGERLVKQA